MAISLVCGPPVRQTAPVDSIATLARDPSRASADAVRAAVLAAAVSTQDDPPRRQALADALAPLLPVHADTIAGALPASFLARMIQDGRFDLATLVIDRLLASAALDRVQELRTITSASGSHAAPLATTTQLALARALAFVHPADARRLLARLPVVLEDGSSSAPRAEEAEALLLAVADIAPVEGAARRALARVAAERSWRPDAWGRDHGALVSLVRRRSKRDSDGFGGPLMQYLTAYAPDEVARIAKRGGGAAGGGKGAGRWWAAGSTPIAGGSVGQVGTPSLAPDPQAWYQAQANEAASARDIARVRRAGPIVFPTVKATARPGRPGAPRASATARSAQAEGRRASRMWVVPTVIIVVCAGLALVMLLLR